MVNEAFFSYKNEFTESLLRRFNEDEVKSILYNLEYLSTKYDIVQKRSDIIESDSAIHISCKMYIIFKKLSNVDEKGIWWIESNLRRFFATCMKDPENVTSMDVIFYMSNLKLEKRKDYYINGIRKLLFDYYDWCINEGIFTFNPVANVDKIKIPPGKPREPLTPMEVELMRKNCIDLREKAIFETLYSTGCRVSELVGMNKKDVDIKEGIGIVFGKGKKYRKVFFNPKSIISVKDYLDSRNDDSEALFASFRRPHDRISKRAVESIIRIISERAGITYKLVSPHVIRHTTATVAMNNGMKLEDISRMLGHVNIATTMIYAKVNMDNVKRMHEKCIV